MGRSIAVTVAVGLLVVACSGDGEVASTTATGEEPAGSSTSIESQSGGGGSTSTLVDSTTTTAEPDGDQRPLAPDFTLDLGTGGTYTLSETDNPVYLVFWAEW